MSSPARPPASRSTSLIRIALWQHGRNENTNGLLRHQYMPQGTDLVVFSQAELDDIAWQMNVRTRKSLDWTCPAELFMPESFDVRQHHHEIVAFGRNGLLLHFNLETAFPSD
ncbi:MAG: hypothetical protein VB142_03300 [Burkholderia sp.]